MDDNESPIWPCEQRTKAKLEILNSYLGAWFNILGNAGFKHVVYLDGFCGPGRYSTGEAGSPVIAVKHAGVAAERFPGFYPEIICIDEDQNKLDYLSRLPSVTGRHDHIKMHIFKGTFEAEVRGIFERLNVPEGTPAFCFIDPFGFGETPLELISPLVRNDSTELFINFWCGFMNRFKEHPDQQITEKIKGMVGSNNLDQVINSDDPISELCGIYQENLSQLGKFTLRFMMRDKTNVRDNALLFCGNNKKGFEKIKEAMWKMDPIHGCGFSAFHEGTGHFHNSFDFINEPDTHSLGVKLMEEFDGKTDILVSTLNQWVIENTETFLPKHLKTELDNLLERNRVTYSDPEPTGRKRRKRSWPDRIKVSFRKDGRQLTHRMD